MKRIYLFIASLMLAVSASAALVTVNNSGFEFSPDTVTINQGDSIDWFLGAAHNVVEVAELTWIGNMSAPLPGGFSTPFGGGMVAFNTPGTFYYVCSPHASFAMKGVVIVAGGAQNQMDLPVTLDDPTVNYSTIDFGGTLSSIVTDPTDPSNQVIRTEKTAGSVFWAGTTLAVEGTPPGTPNDLAFATAIPFTATETRLSVRVWAPAVGIPVMLKVEDQLNGTIFAEAQDVTSVANAWDTLYFDYSAATNGSLVLTNTYDKVSLFYNFTDPGGVGAGDIFYWDDIEFNPGMPGGPTVGQMDLPVSFDDTANVNYSTIDFGGTSSTFVVDPTDPTNQVVRTEKTPGAQFWAGTTLAVEGTPPGTPNDLAFASAIPFTMSETRLSVRVWAPNTGIPVMLKVEDASDAGILVEAQDTTTVAMAWDTLYFDFANATNGSLNLANTYDKASLFYHFEDPAGVGAGQVFFWDDVMFNPGASSGGVAQMDLPVTFDDTANVNYSTIDFGGTSSTFVVDPTDPTNQVVRTEKTPGAQFWAGTTLAVEGTPPGSPNDLGFASAIPFTMSETRLSVRVWAPNTGIPVMLKVEDASDAGILVEAQDTTTVAMAWDTLYFDFANATNGSLNLANTYDKASLFYHFEDPAGAGAGQVFFWDDVMFNPGAPAGPSNGLSPYCETSVLHFGGDPGSEMLLTISNLDDTTMYVEIMSPTNDTADVLIISNGSGATISGEDLSVPGKIRRTLTWATPPATVDLNVLWSKVSFPGNWQLSMTDVTVNFADTCGAFVAPPMLDQMDLPVTFDDTANIEYATIDFGGTSSSFVVDPTDPTNQVVRTEKMLGAQFWAGTTLAVEGTPPGAPNDLAFANAIPFTATETRMSVRVWSPDTGIPVMLKVEDQLDATIFVEAQDTTTVAMAWDTLYFDFALATNGALNLANTYDKASLFYHFNDPAGVGTGQVFYWDDVMFNPGAPVMDANVDFSVDMRGYTGALNFVTEGVFVNGTWNAFCGACNPLTDLDGDSIYTGTIAIPPGTQEYKYTIGAFVGEEDLTLADGSCTVTNFGFTNREVVISGDVTLDTVCWESCQSCDAVDPCDGVTTDNNIFEDFECQRNLTYTFSHGTLDLIANPDPTGVNTSSMVGSYTRNPAEEYDVIVADFASNLDLSSDDLAHIDVWTDAGIDFILSFQDAMDNIVLEETYSTAGGSSWETFDIDLSSVNMNTTISKVVILFEPMVFVGNTYYFDNFILDGTATDPCAGVMPDPNVLDDYECQGNITYTFMNATWTEDVPNPDMSGINASALVGEFIHWGAGTDGAFGGTLDLGPLDFSTNNQLKMDVWTNASSLPITVVLQTSTGTDIVGELQTTTSPGGWETLNYDMSAATMETDISSIVFVINPGTNIQDTVYIDNVRLDGFTVNPCEGTVPNKDVLEDFDCQRNIDYQFAEGGFTVIPNPDPSGINTSASIGSYIRNNTVADAFGGDFILAPLDFATNNQIKMMVWDANAPSEVTMVLQDAAGADVGTAVASTTTVGTWEDINFDFSGTPDAAGVSKVVMLFDAGSQVDSNQVYLFDSIRMEGFVTGINDIYANQLNVYPNPATSLLQIDFEDAMAEEAITISIVAIDGRTVLTKQIETPQEGTSINVEGLSTGNYVVKLTNSKNTWISKFVKAK